MGCQAHANEARMKEIQCFLWRQEMTKETVDSSAHEEQLNLKMIQQSELGKQRTLQTVGERGRLSYQRQDLEAAIATAP